MSTIQRAIKENSAENLSPVRPHLLFLDGMRAIAAFYVMLVHVWAIYGLTATHGWVGHFEKGLRYGHLAVDVFIVISGYCLVIPAAQTGKLKDGAKYFLWKRAHRILPPYYACMAICLLLNIIVQKVGHSHGAFTGTGLALHLLLLQDFFPLFGNQFNGPLWSVALEWKIYFFFPLIIILLQRFGVVKTLVATAILGYGLALPFNLLYPDLLLHPACPWYLFLFGLGAGAGWACYRIVNIHHLNLLKYAMLVPVLFFSILMYFYSPDARVDGSFYGTLFPVIDPLVGLITASSLLLIHPHPFLLKHSVATTILSSKPLVFIGSFSYSIYLMHVPLASMWRLFIMHSPCAHFSEANRAFFNIVIGIPFVIFSAYIFHLLFERPFQNQKREIILK